MVSTIGLIGIILGVIGLIQWFREKQKQAFLLMTLANALLCVAALLLANMVGAMFNGVVCIICIIVFTKIENSKKSDE